MEAKKLLQNCQRLLENISIRNPYAEYLTLPNSVFKPRRTNTHYLYLINTIAFYHQYGRKKHIDTDTGEEYIEVTFDDIKTANELIKETLLIKSDHISANCRDYLNSIKTYLQPKETETFTGLELRKHLRLPKSTQWRYHRQLLEYGYIKRHEKTNPAVYSINHSEEYQKWQSHIDKVLKESISNIEKHLKEKQ